MSRKIDIELTSDRGDGTWTWRAAGAKQPKGVVAAALLPDDAAVGRQLRAEIETTLDGTDVLSVSGPKAKNRAAVETIELIPRGGDEPLVTQTLVGKRGGRDRGDRGDRGPRGDRDRGPRRDGDRRPGGRDGDRDRGRGPGGERGRGRPDGERSGGRGDRPTRPDGERTGRGPRPDRPRRERPAPPPKPKAKRLRAGRTHRKAALDLLSSEEQVIGELLLNGGVPTVRATIEKQNAQAKAEGTRQVSAAPLLVIAERLWPALRVADWRDKAEAAVADLDELDLRDLRSVVVAADSVAKDPESADLAAQLRDGLTNRLDHEQQAWLTELSDTLREGRVVRALRLSSRPPKAGAPLPADLAAKLAEAAGAALASDTLVDRWATVLDALSFSPVRLSVVPASKPDEPSAELVAVVTRMAERVPKVAEAFGIDPSAVPAKRSRGRGGRPGGGGGQRRPAQGGGGAPSGKKPVPPPPPLPAAADTAPDAAPDASADVPSSTPDEASDQT
jgi:hypothetical protein